MSFSKRPTSLRPVETQRRDTRSLTAPDALRILEAMNEEPIQTSGSDHDEIGGPELDAIAEDLAQEIVKAARVDDAKGDKTLDVNQTEFFLKHFANWSRKRAAEGRDAPKSSDRSH